MTCCISGKLYYSQIIEMITTTMARVKSEAKQKKIAAARAIRLNWVLIICRCHTVAFMSNRSVRLFFSSFHLIHFTHSLSHTVFTSSDFKCEWICAHARSATPYRINIEMQVSSLAVIWKAACASAHTSMWSKYYMLWMWCLMRERAECSQMHSCHASWHILTNVRREQVANHMHQEYEC